MNFVLLCILTFVHDIGLVMETRSHGQSCRVEAVTTLILVLVEVLRGLDLRAGGGEGETLLLETDAKEGRLEVTSRGHHAHGHDSVLFILLEYVLAWKAGGLAMDATDGAGRGGGPAAWRRNAVLSPIAFPAYFLDMRIGAQLRRAERNARRVCEGQGC